jgi:hypothetical protein
MSTGGIDAALRLSKEPNWLLAPKSGQPANDCSDHQKEGRPNAELAPVCAAKAVMRCGVDLVPNFTEGGNFFGNSFHGHNNSSTNAEALAAIWRK